MYSKKSISGCIVIQKIRKNQQFRNNAGVILLTVEIGKLSGKKGFIVCKVHF